MATIFCRKQGLLLAAALVMPVSGSLSAQDQSAETTRPDLTVTGDRLTEGPKIEGIISAREGDEIWVTTQAGQTVTIALDADTKVRGTGGFLGLNRKTISTDLLLNGLPVTVETMQWEGGFIASEVKFKNRDLETAAMIRNGTAQQFAQQGAAITENTAGIDENSADIDANTAATEALRGRVGDIDKYNIKGTTNVFFDTGKWNLSPQARTDLCGAVDEANALDNALLLVVGYTDSTGSYEVNQRLSERRAGRVVNYLQQECGWQPWRMLSPTGMAASDPLADNSTPEGKAQNRRVSVNILVSKGLDGI